MVHSPFDVRGGLCRPWWRSLCLCDPCGKVVHFRQFDAEPHHVKVVVDVVKAARA
jgi:hypothetical protein